MTPNEYQNLANRTMIDGPDFEISGKEWMIIWCAVGLAGESGELIDHIKKGIFHQQGIDREYVKKEIGDVLWYLAGLCQKLDIPMEEAMRHNIEKLKARYPDGWDHERSTFKEGIAG